LTAKAARALHARLGDFDIQREVFGDLGDAQDILA
jgi:hypothetical protein